MSEPQTNWVNEEDPVKARLKYILDSPPHHKGGFHPETVRIALEALARIEELEAQLAQEEAPSPTDGALPKLPNLMAEMRRIARAHHDGGGCLEEHCGCPGSRLAALIRELQAEFGGVVAEEESEVIFSRLIAKVLENESRRQKNRVSPEHRHATWLRNLQKNRNRSLALSKKRRKEQELIVR